MPPLKPISKSAIPAALEKAQRYRLLNEPDGAESICLDVLAVDTEHEEALVTLLLAITDQFDEDTAANVRRARDVLPRLRDSYKRAYYAGVVDERHAKALLRRGMLRAGEAAYALLRDAMRWYEEAEKTRPAGEDEAILRWNTCARLLSANQQLRPGEQEQYEPAFE
ncbi:MAG: hypothetical protein ABR499_14235 [Gemmatimonadaceae bacterium]